MTHPSDDPPPPMKHPQRIPTQRAARALARNPVMWVLALLVTGVGVEVAFPTTICCGPTGSSARETLWNLIAAEREYRESGAVDEDGDGRGEFGGFLELAAEIHARGRPDEPTRLVSRSCGAPPSVKVPDRAPVLSGAYRSVLPDGTVCGSGYRFRVFLEARSGGAVAETSTGFADGVVDPDLAEVRFVAYAWPDVRRKGAERTFVVTESGDVYATDAAAYEGAAGPAAGAAMSSGTIDSIRGGIASGRRALDGNVWTRLP